MRGRISQSGTVAAAGCGAAHQCLVGNGALQQSRPLRVPLPHRRSSTGQAHCGRGVCHAVEQRGCGGLQCRKAVPCSSDALQQSSTPIGPLLHKCKSAVGAP